MNQEQTLADKDSEIPDSSVSSLSGILTADRHQTENPDRVWTADRHRTRFPGKSGQKRDKGRTRTECPPTSAKETNAEF